MICSTGTSQDWMPHSPALILLMYHHYYYIKDDTKQRGEHSSSWHYQTLDTEDLLLYLPTDFFGDLVLEVDKKLS